MQAEESQARRDAGGESPEGRLVVRLGEAERLEAEELGKER